MDNSFDTSFIPQQPLLKVEGSPRHIAPVNIALVFALIIFFVTLLVWGGMYFYKTNIDRRVLASEKELESKEASLKTDEIDRYKAIDERLAIAKELLQNHAAFSTILTLLEKITAQNIGWTALSYATDNADGSIRINLTGQAPNYSAVYAEAEAWRSMPETLKKVEVGMPQLNPVSGIVTFVATLTIDPGYIKYARLVKEKEAMKSAAPTGTGAPASAGTIVPANTSPKTP